MSRVRVKLPTRTGGRDYGYVAQLDVSCESKREVILDARALRRLEPLAAVRIAMFLDEQRTAGRAVEVVEPEDPATRRAFGAFAITEPRSSENSRAGEDDDEVILGCTRLRELTDVDLLANALLDPLVDHFDDVAVVRDAVLMAFGELCQNAVEHGAGPSGCLVAASRGESEGTSKMMLGIGDLGVGIPDHLRRTHPELTLDEHAIGQALQEGVTGTGKGHRGYGFHWVLRETLVSAATGAQMFIRSGKGSFRREIVDARHVDHGWGSTPTRGTWIAHEWTTVGRGR